MSKLAIAMVMALMLFGAGVADANGGHGRGGGYNKGGHYNGGHSHGGGYRGGYRGGYYRGGGWGWGGGFAVYPRVIIGGPGPFWWGNPYPAYPYGYYPRPLVVVPPQPQVYVQQPEQQQYWYYCEKPKGYYPYVEQCRDEWLKVVPRTDAPNQ